MPSRLAFCARPRLPDRPGTFTISLGTEGEPAPSVACAYEYCRRLPYHPWLALLETSRRTAWYSLNLRKTHAARRGKIARDLFGVIPTPGVATVIACQNASGAVTACDESVAVVNARDAVLFVSSCA